MKILALAIKARGSRAPAAQRLPSFDCPWQQSMTEIRRVDARVLASRDETNEAGFRGATVMARMLVKMMTMTMTMMMTTT